MGCAIAAIMFLIFALHSSAPRRPVDFATDRSDPTDEEYLLRMGSNVSPEIALTVRQIIVDVNGWDTNEVWPEMTMKELLD